MQLLEEECHGLAFRFVSFQWCLTRNCKNDKKRCQAHNVFLFISSALFFYVCQHNINCMLFCLIKMGLYR